MRTRISTYSVARIAVVLVGFLAVAQDAAAGNGDGYESDQGTRIFGTWDPDLEGVSIPFVPSADPQASYESLRIVAGRLLITRKGQAENEIVEPLTLVGVKAKSGARVILKINTAGQHKNIYDQTTGALWEYHVTEYSTTKDGKPLCDSGPNAAFVVPAAWHAGQLSTPTKDTGFTFACVPILKSAPGLTVPPPSAASLAPLKAPPVARQPLPPAGGQPQASPSIQPGGVVNLSVSSAMPRWLVEDPVWPGGAAAKCIDHHYAPWVGGVPTPHQPTMPQQVRQLHRASDALARSFHNICVQAMTADYAGDGKSHTISGTIIAIFDFDYLPVRLLPVRNIDIRSLKLGEAAPRYDDLRFEGIWTEDQGKARAICLSKARWRTLDPLDAGLEVVRNSQERPRGNNSGNLTGAWTYCEDLTSSDLTTLYGSDKPFLFSYSAINERGLYWFPNGAGGITTTHVLFNGKDAEIDSRLRSSCATPCKGYYLGNVLSPDAPLSKEQFAARSTPLYLHKNGKGEYATIASRLSPEGYQLMVLGDDFPEEAPSQGFRPPHFGGESPQPEGYLFNRSPFSDANASSDTGAQTFKLQLWKLAKNSGGNSYCTTTEPDLDRVYAQPMKSLTVIVECPREYKGHDPQQLGYLLVPAPERLPLLVSTPLLASGNLNLDARPLDIAPKPGPVETLGTNATIQTPAAAAGIPSAALQAPAAQAPKAMQQAPAAQAPAAVQQTPR